MDTNKIREAQALIDEARHRGHNIPQLVEAARLLQAELDAAPKVLTDERPLVWMRMKDHTFVSDRIKNDGERTFQDFTVPLYRNPAAGLTVDEVEQAVKEWCLEWVERVAPDSTDWYRLCARLTAAIQAKTSQ